MQAEIDTPGGRAFVGSFGFFDYLTHLQPALGIGWPMAILALLGLIAIPLHWPAKSLILFSFPLIYYAIAASTNLHIDRYIVILIPSLCCLAACSIVAISELLLSRTNRRIIFVSILGLLITGHCLLRAVQWDLAAASPQPPHVSNYLQKPLFHVPVLPFRVTSYITISYTLDWARSSHVNLPLSPQIFLQSLQSSVCSLIFPSPPPLLRSRGLSLQGLSPIYNRVARASPRNPVGRASRRS